MRNRAVALLAVAGLLPGVLGLPSGAAAVAAPYDSVHTFLTGTVALSPSDAWTVGWFGIGTSAANSESLHWNGTKWVMVKTAPEGLTVNGLEGVSATGPSDIWGVGWIIGNCLIEHYNGTKWAAVKCPYKGVLSQLNGVDARTAADAWAVGYVTPSSAQLGLSEHWNGSSWTQVTTAKVSGLFVTLNSVADLAANNVLAVGYYETKTGGKYVQHELAEHWNGTAWQRVTVPTFSGASYLMSVSGSTSAGVTAVGAATVGGHSVPLIESWNGSKFVQVKQPASAGDLDGVTVLSKTSAYAAGETGSGTTLVEHYNGTQWSPVSTPNPSDGGYFNSITADPSGAFVEASGWHSPDPNERPLIEQGNGQTWKITRE